MKRIQYFAPRIFMLASVVFGVLGISMVITQPQDDNLLVRSFMVTVFIILPSFALSVASKYLIIRD